jgi:hypothetical protein
MGRTKRTTPPNLDFLKLSDEGLRKRLDAAFMMYQESTQRAYESALRGYLKGTDQLDTVDPDVSADRVSAFVTDNIIHSQEDSTTGRTSALSKQPLAKLGAVTDLVRDVLERGRNGLSRLLKAASVAVPRKDAEEPLERGILTFEHLQKVDFYWLQQRAPFWYYRTMLFTWAFGLRPGQAVCCDVNTSPSLRRQRLRRPSP